MKAEAELREGVIATLTKDSEDRACTLSLSVRSVHSVMANEKTTRLRVWLDSNKAYDGAFRAAFSVLLGERLRARQMEGSASVISVTDQMCVCIRQANQ